MFKLRTLKFLAVIMLAYAALVIPGLIWPSYFESPAGLLVLVPGLSVYFFNKIGVPGLLEHDGYCGWGLCSPTVLGMVFVVAVWILLAWLVAWAAAEVTKRRAAH
jgi:hypothetical protein